MLRKLFEEIFDIPVAGTLLKICFKLLKWVLIIIGICALIGVINYLLD